MTKKDFIHRAIMAMAHNVPEKWAEETLIKRAQQLADKVEKVEPFDEEEPDYGEPPFTFPR